MTPRNRLFASDGGFTRTELLATLGVLVVLAVFTLLWRARSRDLPRRAVCQQNLKELSAGFAGYAQTTGHLPWAGRSGAPTTNDWLFWQADRRLENSAIAPWTTNFSGRLLRCPGDNTYSTREYPYSYSMNAHLEKTAPDQVINADALILLYEETFPNDGACAPGETADQLASRHLGRSCAAFLDGHVESIAKITGTDNKRVLPRVRN